MKETKSFDQVAYWILRHQQLKSDPRSVGNMRKSLEQNKLAEKRMQHWVRFAARILKPCNSVLDVGCGYGRIASIFCDEGYRYTGIDVSPEAILAAQKNEPRGSYVIGSAIETPLPSSFDLICVLYVFVHFVDDQDWRKLIRTLAKKLAIGGGILFADNFPTERVESAKHVTQRPLFMYEQEFALYGLNLDPTFRSQLSAMLGSDRKTPSVYLARRQT